MGRAALAAVVVAFVGLTGSAPALGALDRPTEIVIKAPATNGYRVAFYLEQPPCYPFTD